MFELTIEGSVATIIIHRGMKGNAVPMSGWRNLEDVVATANTSKANLIVFRSVEPDYFCTGSDLTELETLSSDPGLCRKFRGSMVSAFKRIRSANKPTLALVDGSCFGTGVSIATACDIRIGGPKARFAMTPARFGISYPKEEVERLSSILGFSQAARLLYSCEEIDAHEALRIGLVEIMDDSSEPGAIFIQSVIDNPPASLFSLKASLLGRAGADKRFDSHFATEECNSLLRAYRSGKPASVNEDRASPRGVGSVA